MTEVIVTLQLVRFGTPRTGLWCEQCLLPSAIEQDVRLTSGMHVLGAGTIWQCRDCGREELR